MSYLKETSLSRKQFIDAIRNNLTFLNDEGFLFQKQRSLSDGIVFLKHSSLGFYKITIGYAKYLFYKPYSPNINLRFNKLEEIVSKFHPSDDSTCSIGIGYDKDLVIDQLYSEGNDYNGKKDFEIYEADDLKLFADVVKKVFYEIALPFFEKYDSLEKVYEDSKDLKMEDLGKMFYNYGNDHNLRKIALGYLISKEIGDAEYFNVKEYLEQYLDQAPELFEGLLSEIKSIYDAYQN
ncbi:MAG: hypothetical protein V4683_07445 [Bacteroidota bacterium]